MSKTDSIADSFTIIRNAVAIRKDDVIIPYSRLLLKICEIFKKEGYIENFTETELSSFKKIKVYLRYEGKKRVIRQLRRVSKPGNRVYVRGKRIPYVLNGYGLGLISTSKGILTDREARENCIGGEYIGKVW